MAEKDTVKEKAAAPAEKNAPKKKASEKPEKKPKEKKAGVFSRAGKFLKNCAGELKKVTWLSRANTVRYSALVMVALVLTAAVIGAFDAGAGFDTDAYREQQFDRLAKEVRAALDMELLYRIIEEGA